ncbi:hypothetical protein K469DRAFT_748080 [Zopfia rhizophila CBS 207.26]|uniref:Uncharacterized protein n=1 Tax=Zopfia rhizophila CBS 207.26 TaxID=1314779 RepID=A0A6A6EC82_9PEZI|nr:hypothetical protein K469DRAFT_748080 [Zopfia rhizophila CBS 207.26]
MENIENQLLPFLDRKKLVAAFVTRDATTSSSLGRHVEVHACLDSMPPTWRTPLQRGVPITALGTHGEDIRQQLYAEEQQKLERKPTTASVSPPSMPPINITNVLPGHSHQASLPASQVGTPASTHLSNPTPASSLDIPGLRDIAVRKYSDWQQSKVHDEALK